MSARQEDFVYAEHVLRRGFATEEQVQECLELLSRVRTEMELDETLEGVLLKKGYLAPAQAAVINQTINPEEAGRSRNQIEGYRLLARLGSGAMGSVYKARHVKLDILVALKVLRVELAKSRTQVERLKREAQLAARLSHENIVRSLDVGESNGFHYFAMEFVDGPTARSLIRETRMKEKDALKIVLNVARGLEHAHAAGVIHRDVKPANIMLSKDGRVKLGDFGLARGQGPSELTLEHAAIGTPQYLAPEQAASAANATPRSDLYSLGATLYHLVTGQPPFSGENLAEIFGKVLRSEFEPPEAVVDDLSVDTLYLIHRLMRPNPKDRYANATELIVDLEKSLNGQRIAPSDFKGDYQSFLDARKRKRGAIAAAAMVVILLSAWFTLSTIAKSRERQEQLETCRVLNDRGDGELDALSTLAELEAKRAELVGARAEGDACDEGLLADLDKRIGLLGIDLERVRIADDVLARARANEPNYRVLLGEAEPIRPVLRGAAQRCEYVRNEIRRISDRAAHDAYRAVYTERAYESVDAAIEALRRLADALATRLLPLDADWASDVRGHGEALASMQSTYRNAEGDHRESFESSLRASDYDGAAFHLEEIHREWSEARARAREQGVPAKFLDLFPRSDNESDDALYEAEKRAWEKTVARAREQEQRGRPDEALATVESFLSGAEEFRKTAEVQRDRLRVRKSGVEQEQLRAVAELDGVLRNELGERRYASAANAVSERKAQYAWFGEGKRRFAILERRAESIRRLVTRVRAQMRAQVALPATKITGRARPATVAGESVRRGPTPDTYQLAIGNQVFDFTLRVFSKNELRTILAFGDSLSPERGYFYVALAYEERNNPYRAEAALKEARRSLRPTGDPWLQDIDSELVALTAQIAKGEDRARELYASLADAQKRNDHERARFICENLLKNLGWTDLVRKNDEQVRRILRNAEKLTSVGTVLQNIPRENYRTEEGETRILYDAKRWHPLRGQVPKGEKDPEAWLDKRETQRFRENHLADDQGHDAFEDYLHRARYQLLDWRGPVDVFAPGTRTLLDPPGFALQVPTPDLPDRLWWEKAPRRDDHVLSLVNHFAVDRNWSIEFTVEWVRSEWKVKEVVRDVKTGRTTVQETTRNGRVPVYFAVSCGKAIGGIGYFPRPGGGVAGTSVFFDEEMNPEDGHARVFGDFHWHMANDRARRKKVKASDRAWLDRLNFRADVPYRVRLARVGSELHLWMAPLPRWEMTKFTDFAVEEWKKGKPQKEFKRAVHVWYKARVPKKLTRDADFPIGASRFRFFGRVGFTLRDVVVTGTLDGKQ